MCFNVNETIEVDLRIFAGTYMRLTQNGLDGYVDVTETKQVGNDSSFVYRRGFFMGTFGHPNNFILFQDEEFLVLYKCQPEFIFWRIEFAYILSRDQYPTLARFGEMKKVLSDNHVILPFEYVEQAKC